MESLQIKVLLFLSPLFLSLIIINSQVAAASEPIYKPEVINTYPHDAKAFTQGFTYLDGIFYEGTGQYGGTSIRQVKPESGRILKRLDQSGMLFGEGITVIDGKLIQLTWKNQVGLVYNAKTFEKIEEFSYESEGWGITHDESTLYMSDGTSVLYLLDPENYEQVGQIEVYSEKGAVHGLNELEFARGELFANVFPTHYIARIDPETGKVIGWIDASSVISELPYTKGLDVLNGIAYDAEEDRIFITGKYWPVVFEIELVRVN